jgi:hypothetical protein
MLSAYTTNHLHVYIFLQWYMSRLHFLLQSWSNTCQQGKPRTAPMLSWSICHLDTEKPIGEARLDMTWYLHAWVDNMYMYVYMYMYMYVYFCICLSMCICICECMCIRWFSSGKLIKDVLVCLCISTQNTHIHWYIYSDTRLCKYLVYYQHTYIHTYVHNTGYTWYVHIYLHKHAYILRLTTMHASPSLAAAEFPKYLPPGHEEHCDQSAPAYVPDAHCMHGRHPKEIMSYIFKCQTLCQNIYTNNVKLCSPTPVFISV